MMEDIYSSVIAFIIKIVEHLDNNLIEVLVLLVELFFDFLTFCVELLPDMPDLPDIPAVPPLFVQLNYFLPISETLQIVAVLGGVFVARSVLNFARFVRGGG